MGFICSHLMFYEESLGSHNFYLSPKMGPKAKCVTPLSTRPTAHGPQELHIGVGGTTSVGRRGHVGDPCATVGQEKELTGEARAASNHCCFVTRIALN